MKYTNFENNFLKMLICEYCVYLRVSGNAVRHPANFNG